MLSNQLLQAPFELLSIAITLFLTGIAVYLGSSLANNVDLSTGGLLEANRGGVIAFVVTTYFILALFGQVLGGKDVEVDRCRQHAEYFRTREDKIKAGNEKSIGDDGSREQIMSSAQLASEGNPDDDTTRLADALRKAAEAHRICATHDAEVAVLLRRLRVQD